VTQETQPVTQDLSLEREAQVASFYKENTPPIRNFKGRDILLAEQFDRESLEILFHETSKMEELLKERKITDLLSPFILATLFYEPSTRTRLSFETSMVRLGGKVISESSVQFSSQMKGEVLEDTIRVVEECADVIALRHPKEGSAQKAADFAFIPIINAGDGGGQHPTQAFLDVYTIKKELGRLEDFTITMLGDLRFGRTVHSLTYLLLLFPNISLHFVAPAYLKMPEGILRFLERKGVEFSQTNQLDEKTYDSDVVYVTRVQEERIKEFDSFGPQRAELLKNSYQLPADFPKISKAIILHPLPRLNEIPPEVDQSPTAAFFRQSSYGIPIRMALLKLVLLGN